MNLGKVSQSVLGRSVFKYIKARRNEVAVGPIAGEDCAVLHLEEAAGLFLAQSKMAPYLSDAGTYAVLSVVNKIAAQGGVCIGVMVHAILPANAREIRIKELMQELDAVCARYDLQILGGHTELSDAVSRPVVSLTGVGRADAGKDASQTYIRSGGARPGQDVVITKWVGLEGTVILAKEREKELLERLPKHFIKDAAAFDRLLCIRSEAATAIKSGVSAMHAASEGGIFGALWELAESAGVGLSVDLKKIPIKQETIEISEFFHINPYELLSGGSLLLVTENGNELVRQLAAEQIPATVIGITTDGNDRVLTNGEEIRFLVPPKRDEIYQRFAELS
ncbi:MAG: hydrogenase maturation factor [Lachnospiraceae bacterium]|nr:hydrogenase maturation factor [Lachnospiraceae bacterium]